MSARYAQKRRVRKPNWRRARLPKFKPKKERSKRKAVPVVEPVVVPPPVVVEEVKPEVPADAVVVVDPAASLAEGTLHRPAPKPG